MEMNEYFCMLKPSRPNMHATVTEEEGEIFNRHCEYLLQKFKEKKVLQAGTSFEKDQDGFAIVILSAENKEKAEALIKEDPAVAKGLLQAHITEYNIFLDRGLN